MYFYKPIQNSINPLCSSYCCKHFKVTFLQYVFLIHRPKLVTVFVKMSVFQLKTSISRFLPLCFLFPLILFFSSLDLPPSPSIKMSSQSIFSVIHNHIPAPCFPYPATTSPWSLFIASYPVINYLFQPHFSSPSPLFI